MDSTVHFKRKYICVFVTCVKILFVADEPQPRFKRLRVAFMDPMTEVYLYFFQAALQPYIALNLFMQRDDCVLPLLYEKFHTFVQSLSGKFLSEESSR